MKTNLKSNKHLNAIVFFLILTFISGFFLKSNPKKEGGIRWLSFEQALKESQKDKKKVFIDVYTDWCGWCKKMDASTFSNEKVAVYLNKNFYSVKLDAESARTFEFRGKTISERELAGQIFKVNSYPTTVYLDENFDILSPVPGYLEVPMFDKILKFYGENNYLKQSWQDFEKSYKPSN
ncbi:MAG: thioredoxin family protein [Cytophagales bacterium]